MTLARFQREMAAALLDPAAKMPHEIEEDRVRAEVGFSVHRGNVRGSLVRALTSSYPVVRALVGEKFFAAMAWRFVLARPPRRSWLTAYGDEFPEFIAEFSPAAALPFLPDLARLERLVRSAAEAPDDPPLCLAAWSKLAPSDVLRLRPPLHPSVQLFELDHQILAIWRSRRPASGARGDLGTQRTRILVLRSSGRPSVREISAGEEAIVLSLRKRSTIRRAITAALELEPTLDVADALVELVRAGALLHQAPSF